MTCNRQKGICFSGVGTSLNGEELTVRLVAWSREDAGSLHWELARVFEQLLRYEATSSNTMPSSRLKDLRTKWGQLAAKLAVQVDEVLFTSPQSYLVRQQPPPDNVDCMSSVKTALLLLVLCDSVAHRRPLNLRPEVDRHANLFLERSLSACDANRILTGFEIWNARLASLCSLSQNHAGQCAHVRAVIDALNAITDRTPQSRIFLLLSLLYVRSDFCKASLSKLAEVCHDVAYSIDDRCEVWGIFNLTTVPWLADNNGKRASPHLKRFLAEEAMKAKRGKTVQNAIAGAGLQWDRKAAHNVMTQSMCDFTSACFQHFEGCPSVSCITDGVRIGKPAKELIATVIENLSTGSMPFYLQRSSFCANHPIPPHGPPHPH